MPECSGKECTYGTTYKISCHKNGINTVGCFRVEGENRSLITQLDTLHTYIYNKNSGDDTHVRVLTEIKLEPRHKNQATTYVIQSFDSQNMYIFSYIRGGESSCYAAQS